MSEFLIFCKLAERAHFQRRPGSILTRELPVLPAGRNLDCSTLVEGGGLMKFSDLFIPKIARSDPKVREKAALECTDIGLLQRVLQNDKDEHVRQVVTRRIEALKAGK
jgi:hypothetical protein